MVQNLCDRCAADCRHHRAPNEIVVKCGAFKPTMTNADRIRSMNDEELAKAINLLAEGSGNIAGAFRSVTRIWSGTRSSHWNAVRNVCSTGSSNL